MEYTKTHAAISELPPGITAKAVLYEKAVQENRNFLIHRRDKCQSILLETDPIKVVREIAGKGDTLDSKKIDNIISNFGTNFLFKEGGWRPV